jgi:type IV pilus assembly protein PilQ
MSRVRSLAALTAVALTIGAPRASAALPDNTAIASRDGGRSALASVTAVSIVPGEQGAHVVLALSGEVRTSDFTLGSPHRLVIDIAGARLDAPVPAYDRVSRAGIRNVRLSQYRTDVVRLVLELESPRDYDVQHADGELRIAVSGSTGFAGWNAGSAPARAVATGVVATDATAVATSLPRTARMSAAAAAVNASTPQQSQQPRITVTYQDAEIRDVIAGISAFANRTIVVGKDVQGTVNAEIKDQPWDVALQAILAAQGLAATEEASGIIVVDSYSNILTKQASEPVTTQLVSINYANAASLVGTVGSLLSKDCPKGAISTATDQGIAQPGQPSCVTRGSITADTATNTLLVTEVESRLPALLRYVRDLDVRTPQVALKAKVIAINRTQAEQLGITYDFGSSAAYFNTVLPRPRPGDPTGATADNASARVALGGDAIAAVANASRKFSQTAALNLLFTTALGNYSVTAFLDALKENNLSDIQAEPSVVTLDNRMATILVGQETPIRVIDAGSAGTIGQQPRATVQFKESGIILKVTPHITSNRQIRMSVEAEQSQLRVVGGDLGFFFDKNNANTNLLVNDGETAVIGGLTQTQVTRNKSGIPFLVDLPLVGKLFGQTETREEKRDLLILITPHIVEEGEAVRPPSGGR